LENKDLPSIFAFPKGKYSWRIDWFGELAFPNRFQRHKQPSVLVLCDIHFLLPVSFRPLMSVS
jgi:hypothetical protein